MGIVYYIRISANHSRVTASLVNYPLTGPTQTKTAATEGALTSLHHPLVSGTCPTKAPQAASMAQPCQSGVPRPSRVIIQAGPLAIVISPNPLAPTDGLISTLGQGVAITAPGVGRRKRRRRIRDPTSPSSKPPPLPPGQLAPVAVVEDDEYRVDDGWDPAEKWSHMFRAPCQPCLWTLAIHRERVGGRGRAVA